MPQTITSYMVETDGFELTSPHDRQGNLLWWDCFLIRYDQGLGNRLILPPKTTAVLNGIVRRRQQLGGMLNYYYREAA